MKKQVGDLRIMSIQCVQFGKEFPFIVLSFRLFSSVKWCLWILLCMNTCVYWAWVDFFTLTLSALSLNVCHRLWSWPWKMEFFVSPNTFISSWALPPPLLQMKRQSSQFSLTATHWTSFYYRQLNLQLFSLTEKQMCLP